MKRIFSAINKISLRNKLMLFAAFKLILIAMLAYTGTSGITNLKFAVNGQDDSSKTLRSIMVTDMMHDGIKGDVINALYMTSGKTAPSAKKEGLEEFEENDKTFKVVKYASDGTTQKRYQANNTRPLAAPRAAAPAPAPIKSDANGGWAEF